MQLSEMNIGLLFGTDTGNTEEIAEKIVAVLAEHSCPVEIINVVDASPEMIESFDFIIMGTPTWASVAFKMIGKPLKSRFSTPNSTVKL